MKKIAIYYDILLASGGASRVVLALAEKLDADLIVAGISPNAMPRISDKMRVINIGNSLLKFHVSLAYLFEAPLRFLFYKEKKKYDVNIFFGQSSIYAARKGKSNIYYCFSPNRILYDLRSWSLKKSNTFLKFLYLGYICIYYPLDQWFVKNNFKIIISQSKTIQERVSKYYGIDSEIINSPLDTGKFKFKSFGEYYLAVSRLTPEKRIDLIAKSFVKNKEKKLIIVGDGNEKEKIKKIILNHNNITLLDKVDDDKLIDLYANCLATIYMPMSEDYGLVPLEGMASGKVCIAANEGGCRETIIEGKTGFLINPTEKDISKTILGLTKFKLEKMKDDCIKRAQEFDSKVVLAQWRQLLNTL